MEVQDADSLVNFFADCFGNRAVAATKMNDRSSRSHAIYTVLIDRTLVDVSEGGSKVCAWVQLLHVCLSVWDFAYQVVQDA